LRAGTMISTDASGLVCLVACVFGTGQREPCWYREELLGVPLAVPGSAFCASATAQIATTTMGMIGRDTALPSSRGGWLDSNRSVGDRLAAW
jgi:hypothetical protein